MTLDYVCKYTPVELLAGCGAQCRKLDPLTDSFEAADSLGHPNLCGYAKALLEELFSPQGGQELVLVNCCDALRRVYDIVRANRPMAFLYLLDLPHKSGSGEAARFRRGLKDLAESYLAYAGTAFDPRLALAAFQTAPLPEEPFAQLLGAHGGGHLCRQVEQALGMPVADHTCSGPRALTAPAQLPGDLDSFLDFYAPALLGQPPCMRMTGSRPDRGESPYRKGIVYHTMKFCDYYGFEYAARKDQLSVPLLKIETDCTPQSQLRTRLEAFGETLSPLGGKGGGRSAGAYVAGIDSGSTSTDVAVLDRDRRLVAQVILPTGAGAAAGAERALSLALEQAGLSRSDLARVVTTGYGRSHIGAGDSSVTEITCHARGAHYLDSAARTVIDIGGQDSKVIRLDGQGGVESFVMNDKCAAGTGRFLEMMARTLELSLEEMSTLGLAWKHEVTISSMCTVFAESEVVSLVAQNTPPADIIHGLNRAVAAKTVSLVKRTGGGPGYLMTGGVAKNQGVVAALTEKLGAPVAVHEASQLCGAIGAALIGLDGL